MKKRLLSLLLALSMMLSLFPATAIAATKKDTSDMPKEEKAELLKNPFWDVGAESWCYDAVQYARINGFFNGTTEVTFDPNGTMTRGMFVTVLGRIAGVDPTKYEGEPAFSDVPESKYYAPYIAWASKYGITLGVDETHFDPNAKINRQQMAAFFVRYFEAFDVDYETDANITTIPADLDTVSDYAKDAVLKLWKNGLLNGDGTNFNPKSSASRAQTATLTMRTDKAVETWYTEPGVPSTRESIDPETLGEEEPVIVPSKKRTVTFYDGTRKITTKSTTKGKPLSQMPTVEEYSKAGAVLEGYYLDAAFTKPFYANTVINQNMKVYAKYQEMDTQEILNLTTFTQMDQAPDLSFNIKRVSGAVEPAQAATVVSKDGSDPVTIRVDQQDGNDYYTVFAPAGFNEGCTYELTLAEGWVFDGKADTIRTASFSIKMEEVANLRMNEDIVYIQDSETMDYTVSYKINGRSGSQTYTVLKSDSLDIEGADPNTVYGTFTYAEANNIVSADDLLCIYVGLHPNDRIAKSNDNDPTNDDALLDPAVYVKVTAVNDDTITFTLMSAEDQQTLYEVPDLFPFMLNALPIAEEGQELTVNIKDLDLSMYETAVGKDAGTVRKAREKVNKGDFIVLYTQLSAQMALSELGEVNPLQYGRVTDYDSASGTITYTFCTEEDLMNSMDLYSVVDVQGNDLVSDAQVAALEQSLYEQVSASGFAEEAAYLLSDLVTKTDNFRDDLKIQDLLLTDSEGNVLSDEDIQLMNIGSSFELTDEVKLTVELINKGEQLHFNDGVQLAIGVDASFEVEAEDGVVAIDLSATFVQEAMVKPSVKGGLTYTKILGIKFPNGVQVNATVDVMSYTALSFAAEIYTVAEEEKDLWTKMQELAKNPTSVLGLPGIPAELAKGLSTVGDVMDKIDELQNAVDRGTLAVQTAKEYKKDIETLWAALENNDLASREEWETMGEALGKTSITSDLMDMMNLSAETGLSTEYYDTVEELLQKYSDTVTKETDWIKLLEEQIFAVEVCVCGICIGVDAKFVVRADMSIAIGSNLEYEVGKRYSFWFKIGLYAPTAGNDTTDLIDEKFAFQFYVMGRLGVKAGVRASLYAGIGSKAVASVGIAAELGPYIKLWGFFIYEYSKYRPANTQNWTYRERMMGGLLMEFGLYFMLSFEAQALGLFEYSHDFLDEEIPLLTSGAERFYYDFAYEPETDDVVIVRDHDSDSTNGITMTLPDEVRALSYMELRTGRRGSEPLDYSKYKMKVSNPNFSVNEVGEIVVTPPDNMRYMECDLTITYLQGKMAFSNYDMSVTIPLVWTNLSVSELKEYYTVSVRVGDGEHFDTVWSKRVLKSTPFNLPTEKEIKDLIGWSDVKYKMNGGYGGQDLTDLTVVQNTTYDFRISYPTYKITVTGIQNADGSTDSRTFTAKYGEAFDFSELKNTGTAKKGEAYTKFANVTTNATVKVNDESQAIDLTKPINAKVAQVLKSGNVTAQANYVDSSIKAIFTLSGITYDEDTDIVKNNEVTVILGKGEAPSLTNVAKAVEDHPSEGIAIASISPDASLPIHHTTNYNVTCVSPTGERNLVHFDLQGGSYLNEDGETVTEIEPMNKLVGSLLVNLPDEETMSRVGYDFDGWFTEPKIEENNSFASEKYGENSGKNALTQIVPAQSDASEEGAPAEPYTLYANWTPKAYKLTFDLNGGNQLIMKTVDGVERNVRENDGEWEATMVYTHAFGNYYAYTENAKNLKGLSASEMYNGLPMAYSEQSVRDPDGGSYNVGVSFAGWYCDLDGDGIWFEEGEEVTDETIFNFTDDVTLKARWRTKVAIPPAVFSFEKKTVTYDGNDYAPKATFNGGKGHWYYLDKSDEQNWYELAYPKDGYVIDYKRQGSDEYVRRSELPHVAGVYDVRVERAEDENFAKMSWYNPYMASLKIKKAASRLDSATITAAVHGAAVFVEVTELEGILGDGAIEYSLDGENWNTTGAFYDLNNNIFGAKTYTVYVRIGEGMNYAASTEMLSTTFKIENMMKSVHYEVRIKTDSEKNGGTDSNIYAIIGGNEQHLDQEDVNDFEKGREDSYWVTVPSSLSIDDGNLDVTIKLEAKGNSWHWKMEWIRLDVYDVSSLIRSAETREGTEYDNDPEEHTYHFSGLGRQVDESSYGLRKSGNAITINETISDNYKSNYDPLYYKNAPQFVAYFDNSVLDKYITRVGLYEYRIDEVGLKEAMDEFRDQEAILHYGIRYETHGGTMGASDYMQSYTYTIDLPYEQ